MAADDEKRAKSIELASFEGHAGEHVRPAAGASFHLQSDGTTVGLWRRGPAPNAKNAVDDFIDPTSEAPTHSRCAVLDIEALVDFKVGRVWAQFLSEHAALERHRFERYPLVIHELKDGKFVLWRLEVIPNGGDCLLREVFF